MMFGRGQQAAARVEILGAVLGTSSLTTVGNSGVANTKGSWVDLGTASFSYEEIVLAIGNVSSGIYYLLDLAISDGTNRWVIVENIYFSCRTAGELTLNYSLPIRVPSGAILSARCQSSTSTASVDAAIYGFSASRGGNLGCPRCVTLGANTATTRGTVIDPGTTIDNKGAWTELSSSLPANITALSVLIGPNGDLNRASWTAWLFDIGVGAAGSESVVLANAIFSSGAALDLNNLLVVPPLPIAIPAGSRVAARAQCSSNTAGDRAFDMIVLGFA